MLRLSHRRTMLRTSILGCLLAAVLSITAYFIINLNDTTIATRDGENVTISKKAGVGDINYGDHQTHWYEVTNQAGDTYTGYCAEPSKDSPSGTKRATLLPSNSKNNRIKLMIYLRENDNATTSQVRASLFDPIKNDSKWGNSQTNRIYAFTHAVIGIIYGGDDTGLYPSMEDDTRDARNTLTSLISDNSAIWQLAKKYNLFYANKASTGDDQDIVWIEATGSITAQKCDAEITSSCIAQGDANYNGISFTLYDSSNNVVETKTLTGGAKSVTFDGLNLDMTYTIREGGSNAYYNLTAAAQSTKPSVSGTTLTFRNNVKKGSLKVYKIDKDTDSCTLSSPLMSFAGTKFQLINRSASSVYYNSTPYATGAVIDTVTFAANQCDVTFNNLPYGTYELKEIAAGRGYVLDSVGKTITIPTNNNAAVTYRFENQPIRGDVKFVKKDPANGVVMNNAVFSISSLDDNNRVMETHIVVADENGIVDTSANAHSFHTNGYDELYDYPDTPLVYSGYGSWFGIDVNGQAIRVKDDVGALPYGTYLIQELRCEANFFCSGVINEKQTIQITTHNHVVDLRDWNNSCAEFSIETVAVDEKDGDKFVEAGEKTTIKDTINYCAKKNYTFTIKGTLLDKATGDPIIIDGKKVEQSIEVSPETDCDTAEMLFPIDSSRLAGKSVVVAEELYYKDNLKTSHKDLDDEDQTIDIISLSTVVKPIEDGTKTFPHDSDITVNDEVHYCLQPNREYVLKGVVIDKSTGNPLLINNEPIEQEATFTPTEACGEFEMSYEFNTTGLAGAELVIFERLYLEDELILEHRDLGNDLESFNISMPVTIPETGYITGDASANKGSAHQELLFIAGIAVAPVGLYVIKRYQARKRFLK